MADYLKENNVQEALDELVNALIQEKPENPLTWASAWLANKGASKAKVTKLAAREILDSRGNPTVEVDVYTDGTFAARGAAPSGASTGSNEALELRDGDKDRFLGKGVTQAVANVTEKIAPAVVGASPLDLRALDKAVCDADGTELKKTIGGNAVTAASFAFAHAGAKVAGVEVFQHLAKAFANGGAVPAKFSLPVPLSNVLNGGKHAGGKLKIQEFMVVPPRSVPYSERLRMISQIYHHLGKILVSRYGKSAKNLGDEGGFAPQLDTPDQALEVIEQAIAKAGYTCGREEGDVGLALDCAASEFYEAEKGYEILEGKWVTSSELVDFYVKMVDDHPALVSIEDAMDEKDYEGWIEFTAKLGDKVMVVGDDLYTTNTNLIAKGLEAKWANALLLKVNQIGTISEAMDAAQMLFDKGQQVVVSHRSGETAYSTISDLVVAIGAGYIKTGAPARGERTVKYNRLLQIEEFLAANDMLA